MTKQSETRPNDTREISAEVKRPFISGVISIGPYTIASSVPGISGGDSPWIHHESGEGMATTPEKLLKLIEDFYREEM